MSAPKTITFRMDSEKIKALDAIATRMQRDRSFLLNEAVDAYLEWSAGLEHSLLEGLKDARAGRFVEHEEVLRRMANVRKKRKTA